MPAVPTSIFKKKKSNFALESIFNLVDLFLKPQ